MENSRETGMPRYRLWGLRTPAPALPSVDLVAGVLGVRAEALSGFSLARRSLDARKKPKETLERLEQIIAAKKAELRRNFNIGYKEKN